jgi:hypothetical protein
LTVAQASREAIESYNASQALDPEEAAVLFRSGTELAFLTDPYVPFVMGRWMNQQVLCVAVPADPVAYFTENPVIIYGTYVPPAPGVAVSAVITLRSAGWIVRGNNMAVTLPNGKVVDLTIEFEDSDGNPASAPGDVAWSSSDESIVTVVADSDDDTKAVATSVAAGDATITGSSSGITATLEIEVISGGAAVSATITAGEPRDPDEAVHQPAAAGRRAAAPSYPPTRTPTPPPIRPGVTGQAPRPPGQRPR